MKDTPANKPRQASWRAALPVHPAAELFPLMSPGELRELAKDIRANGLRSSCILQNDHDGRPVLLDGRNRLDALALLGEEITLNNSFIFDNVPDDVDPVGFVVSANIHRRHLTAEQKRDLIAKLLEAQPEKSNRQIAETVKVDHKTVASVRAEKEGRGEIPHVETRTDTKGRAQPARKRPIPAAIKAAADRAEARSRASRRKQEALGNDIDPAASADERNAEAAAEHAGVVQKINGFHRELVGFLHDFTQRFTAWHDAKPLIDEQGKATLMQALYLCADGFAHLSQKLDGR